jgi:ubiquinone/menaquinone biosynthesis C-methylase UbiE
MTSDTHLDETRRYYDDFSARYEAQRGGRDPGGYHDLLDELEAGIVERYGRGKDVLEVGCGTGLLLDRFAVFANKVSGIDLSPGMLKLAKERGHDVREGSATALPFADATFDVSCSFKVLAHVKEIDTALSEMTRVVKKGGHIIAEFYNPLSFRGLAKRLGPAGAISHNRDESEVFTRFDAPWKVRSMAPRGTRFVASRGVRIVTPVAQAMRVPVLGSILRVAERKLADSPLSIFGGFWIAVFEKL